MSVFNAMLTSVSGLQAQSYALENISGNIANASTTGFKRVDTRFVDLIPEMPAGREVAGSVAAYAQPTHTLQGQIQPSAVSTHMALSGEGYFAVQEPRAFTNGEPLFDSVELYTRRGDFSLDRNGYLVNGSGHYLRGVSLDPATGAPTTGAAGIVRLEPSSPPRQTSRVDYRSNLPSSPRTEAADPAVPGSELLNAATLATDPTVAGGGIVTGADQAEFLRRSVSGGTMTLHDANGDPVTLQMRWAKTGNGDGTNPDTWELFYLDDANATGANPAWRNAGQVFSFDAAGRMTSAGSFTIASITSGGRSVGPVTFDTGTGLTQFADPSGQVQPEVVSQDGYGAGSLTSLSVTPDGRVVGAFTNGQTVALAQITVAQFAADDALERRDGGAFAQTVGSGQPIYTLDGASISSGALEASNTDIAAEFSKMIVSQQAYNANTRVISTAQQMMQELMNVVR